MAEFCSNVYEVIFDAIEQKKHVWFEIENGLIFPYEEIIRTDGGPELFFFRISEEGASADPELGYKPGDIVPCSFESVVRIRLLKD